MIEGTEEAFDKLNLNKDNNYSFFITLENQDTGDVIKSLVSSKNGFTANDVPIGTYTIKELDGVWFQFALWQ